MPWLLPLSPDRPPVTKGYAAGADKGRNFAHRRARGVRHKALAPGPPGSVPADRPPVASRQSRAVLSLLVSRSAALHVVAEEQVLVADVELAARDHRMGPAVLVRPLGLVEAAMLPPAFRRGLDEGDRAGTILGPEVEPAIGRGEAALPQLLLLPPEGLPRLEVLAD